MCFSHFYKLYKCYQIAQNVSCILFGCCKNHVKCFVETSISLKALTSWSFVVRRLHSLFGKVKIIWCDPAYICLFTVNYGNTCKKCDNNKDNNKCTRVTSFWYLYRSLWTDSHVFQVFLLLTLNRYMLAVA